MEQLTGKAEFRIYCFHGNSGLLRQGSEDLQACLFGDFHDIPWRAFGAPGSQKRSVLPLLVVVATWSGKTRFVRLTAKIENVRL